MGTWGPGVYENDSSLDWLGDLTEKISRDIRGDIEKFDESMGEELLAAVDTLRVVCEHSRGMPPKPDEVSEWQEAYQKNWRTYIADLGADEDFIEQQAKVIESTFARLLDVSSARWKR